MAAQTNFAERYREFSNRKLMEIVEHPEEYLPEAVTAALGELSSRGLSAHEEREAREAMEIHLSKRRNWDWMQSKLWKRFIAWWDGRMDSRRVHIVLGVAFITMLGLRWWRGEGDLLIYLIQDGEILHPLFFFTSIVYVVGLATLPLLLMGKTWGWRLGNFLSTASTLIGLWGIIQGAFIVYWTMPFQLSMVDLALYWIDMSYILMGITAIPVAMHLKVIRHHYRVGAVDIWTTNWLAATFFGCYLYTYFI